VVLVVAAIGVAATLFFLNKGGTAESNPCAGQQQDSSGLTPCMRELAGSVPSRAKCDAMTRADAQGGLHSSRCAFPDKYDVSYYQLGSMRDIEIQVNQFMSTKTGSPKTSDWSGGGLTGTLYVNDMGNGLGSVMFTVTGRPVFGTIFALFPETNGQPPERLDIGTYFDQNVKPGSA
jgi:hypothetical protein